MIPEHPIQGVLLDLDGTLIDGFAPIVTALNQTLEKYGLPTLSDRDIRRHTGIGDGSIEKLFGADWEDARQYFLALHDRHYLEQTIPLPGAEALLDWLKAHHLSAGIVTNKGQHRAESQLDYLGWRDKIQVVIGFIEDRPTKPDPLPVQLACRRMKTKVSRTVFVGDGPADMQAASRAGCFPVGLSDLFTAEELRQAGAQVCLPKLSHVHGWLRQLLVGGSLALS
jgi:phosphoglycolate phosphatase